MTAYVDAVTFLVLGYVALVLVVTLSRIARRKGWWSRRLCICGHPFEMHLHNNRIRNCGSCGKLCRLFHWDWFKVEREADNVSQ